MQRRQQRLHLSALALYRRGEFGTLRDRHADAVNDHVVYLVGSVLGRQMPVDPDGKNGRTMPARSRTATVREIDLARNDRPFRIEPTAGHPGSVTALSILRQAAAKGLNNVVLEEGQELLLPRRQ